MMGLREGGREGAMWIGLSSARLIARVDGSKSHVISCPYLIASSPRLLFLLLIWWLAGQIVAQDTIIRLTRTQHCATLWFHFLCDDQALNFVMETFVKSADFH